MKKVIQRALPLNIKYKLLCVSYLSIEDGGGCACDNCGKLITNTATIQSYKGTYTVGLDCLDTLLLNNDLLNSEDYFKYQYSDKPAIAKAKALRAKIMKQTKKDSSFKAVLFAPKDKDYFGFSFKVEVIKTYKYNGETKSLDKVEPYKSDEPAGFDYRFDTKYKELTLNYLKGLDNVIL